MNLEVNGFNVFFIVAITFLISALLDGILIKNPNQYVIQIIQKSKNLKYTPRVVKELQKDENLYVIKKETVKEGGIKVGQ